ncbi:MAG: cysteine desulfurase [candidate division KSB1 bacterium]|nr:cysteine desulfurase [candidate division KSB1 bacterium]MDZ7275207.1 cysteine desulfurase [candidate division KSB1 bacterium]MDZ7287376.1 cysteine desulfurase [candidate division KSB1 bacterium]MDZ7299490.1 cysteine desulfurase [candidate division KSB1 bacterium]MDZ7305464.1 cysteine desulfurase [candidate division KSB1 bacterium]
MSPHSTAAARLEVERIRRDFPILQSRVRGKPLVYLDNAATSQKPQVVIDALVYYYCTQNANVHRGVYYLSEAATRAYEGGRETVRRFLNAASTREIIFVRGATEGINLVAHGYGRRHLRAGDEIIITAMEHHSNIVPWQLLCEATGAKLRVIPINGDGEWIWEEAVKLFNPKTKFVAAVHISNSLGTINPIARLIRLAHEWQVPVLVDGAQAVPHQPVDVAALDCDFYTFSGHKAFGPTGIGVLYGKETLLEKMAPYQAGGDMIKSVTFAKTTYNDLPYRFEAGTPNIAGVVGLAKALEYLRNVGYDKIAAHEQELLDYATAALATLKPLRIIGTARTKASVVSFVLDGIHPHDVGTILDRDGIAIRTGHHCTQPVMEFFNVPATSRASFAFYNTTREIDALVEGLHKVIKIMAA